MSDLAVTLQDKDDKKAYELSKIIRATSEKSSEFYPYFDEFVGLLTAKSSYVRARGFILCCAQARWDDAGKLKASFHALLTLLYDEKPTVVRQCLGALHEVVLYRPELRGEIRVAVEKIDWITYKDSMSPLIKKDIETLLKMLN